MRRELILIKLGGSVITEKRRSFVARPAVTERLAREIRAGLPAKADVVIAHGGGSFGHGVAQRFKTHLGMQDARSAHGAVLVRRAVRDLHAKVLKALAKADLPAVSFSPFDCMLASGQEPSLFFSGPIEKSLALRMIPVLHGDVVFDAKQGFCIFSAEKVLSVLARKFFRRYDRVRVIFCGDTDGVYDANGTTVPVITPRLFKNIREAIGPAATADVTGGMLHKIEASIALASSLGISTTIVNGNTPGALKRAIEGKPVARTTVVIKGR